MPVVLLHLSPCLRIIVHTLDPECMSFMIVLLPQPQTLRHVVQLVTREPELTSDDLEKVQLFDW